MNTRLTFLIGVILVFSAPFATSQIYKEVSYLGTKQDLKDFIENEMYYPGKALGQNIQGSVKLSFIVDKQGITCDIKVKAKVHPLLDREAVRLVRMMVWEPAEKYGLKVASRHELKIDFKIRKYKKYCKNRGYEIPFSQDMINDTTFAIYNYQEVYPKPTPVFEKEKQNLTGFIRSNLQYPEVAVQKSIKGNVKIEFVVETSGKPSHFRIIESLGGGCNEEAKRIIKLLRWQPGQVNDKAVRTRMSMDITFSLSESSDIEYFHNNQNSTF